MANYNVNLDWEKKLKLKSKNLYNSSNKNLEIILMKVNEEQLNKNKKLSLKWLRK